MLNALSHVEYDSGAAGGLGNASVQIRFNQLLGMEKSEGKGEKGTAVRDEACSFTRKHENSRNGGVAESSTYGYLQERRHLEKLGTARVFPPRIATLCPSGNPHPNVGHSPALP